MFLQFLEQYPFILAFILGLFPALVWLWFWLKEDIHHEPARMVTLSFLGGIASVFVVLPLQKLVYDFHPGQDFLTFTLWAAIEELCIFGFAYFIALRNKILTDEPVDDIIYLIISSLGFVTFENTLFLLESISRGDFANTIISGNLRFIGASLLHVIASATIGVCLALSFYKPHAKRVVYTAWGIVIAIALHTSFNLFIISGAGSNIFSIFGVVWIGIIVLLLLFEKVKHLESHKI
jgi:RsiW-degrading membrane proteinase PrsW (M82 family)